MTVRSCPRCTAANPNAHPGTFPVPAGELCRRCGWASSSEDRIATALERIATALEALAGQSETPVAVSVKLNEDTLIDAMAKARRRGPLAL